MGVKVCKGVCGCVGMGVCGKGGCERGCKGVCGCEGGYEGVGARVGVRVCVDVKMVFYSLDNKLQQ